MRLSRITTTLVTCFLVSLCACSSGLSGETIACHAVDEPLLSGGEARYRIYVMNGDGSERTEIGEGLEVDWSPDGQKLVCVGTDYRSLHVVSLPNGQVSLLGSFDNLIYYPAWSPDARRIAFRALRRNIWVINADGSSLRRLTDYGDDTCVGPPSWSPDVTRIAFTMSPDCRQDTRGDIYVMNSDGSEVTRLTDGAGDYWGPIWSPVADRIAFEQYRDGESSIYVMNADGSGKTRRATGLLYGWSPDGTRIYYHPVGSDELWTVGWDMANHARLFTLPCEEPAWSPVIQGQDRIE